MTTWAQLNPWGAGFQNTGAIAPWTSYSQYALSGGDTSALHKTANHGALWANRNADIPGGSTHGASIEPHPTQAGRWFALMGNNNQGGLWESLDNGDSWTNVSSGTANIFGNGSNADGPKLLTGGGGEHPRSVGRLIALDVANSRIYVATWNHGVYRGVLGATSGVTTWVQIYSTANTYTRGIFCDTVNDVLYFSTFSDPGSTLTTQSGHIWRSANPRAGSPTFTQLTGSPMCGSAMLVLGDRLYTVAHPISANLTQKGLWYLDSAHSASAGAAWTQVSVVPTAGSERWMSLDGYMTGGTTTLWCGCASMGTHSLCKATTSGGAWTGTIYPTSTSTTINDLGGPNTPALPWWMYVPHNSFMLGRSTFVASTIRINPQNHNEIIVWGRSGIWRTVDAGATWYPIVKGIGATVCLTTLCDSAKQNNVYIGIGDWSILYSKDDLNTTFGAAPPFGSFSYSLALDESRTPTEVVTAASPRSDVVPLTSKVYRNPDVTGGGAWIDTGLSVNGEIIVMLGVVYSGATRVYLAGDSGGTIWRKVGDGGAWQPGMAANQSPNGGIALSVSDTHPLTRNLAQNGVAYLYDRGTGVWRTTDAGLHWVRIWSHASGNSSDQSGWVDWDPNSSHGLYVSDSTSVYHISNADTCAQDAATVATIASAIGAKGPMAVDKVNKKIGVCDITADAKFWESAITPINWVNQADSLYQNAAGSPQWLSYDTAGAGHVALSGNGVISQVAGNPLQAPQITQRPGITGNPVGGTVLHPADGTATGNPTPTLGARRWYADGVLKATAATYTVPTDGSIDGTVITLQEDFTNSQGTTTTTSDPTAAVTQPVDPTPVWSVLPSISGTPTSGQTLTGSNGTVSPGSVTSKKWQQSPTSGGTYTDIGGATGTTLVLDDTFVGAYVRYVPHAVNSSTSADQPSAAVGPVAPTVAANTPPVLTLSGPATIIQLPATPQVTAIATDADGIDTVMISLDQGTPVAMTPTTTNHYFTDLGTQMEGAHSVDVVATDLNASPLQTLVSATFTVIAPATPIIISGDIEEIEVRIHQRGLQ